MMKHNKYLPQMSSVMDNDDFFFIVNTTTADDPVTK